MIDYTTTGAYGLFHFDGLDHGQTFYVRIGSGNHQTIAQIILADNSSSGAFHVNLAAKA